MAAGAGSDEPPPPSDTKPPRRRRRIWRWLRRGLYALLLLIFLPPILILLALETGPGQRFVVGQVNDLLAAPDGGIEISDLGGSLWDVLTLGRLQMSDADGVWLTVEGITLDWSPFALISGEADIRLVQVASVDMPRAPLPSGEAPEPEPVEDDGKLLPELPQLPLNIDLERLEVLSVSLGAPLAGVAADLSVTGQASYPQEGATEVVLDIAGLGDTALTLDADVSLDPATEVLGVSLQVQEPQGGLISRLADLPTLPAIDLSLEGEGPLSDWRGRLRLALDETEAVVGDILLAGEPERRFALTGRVDPSGSLPPELLPPDARPWLAGGADLDVDVLLGEEVITLNRLTIQATSVGLSASGSLSPESEEVDAKLSARLEADSPLRTLVPEVDLGAVTLDATVSGPLALPQARLNARVEGVQTAEVELAGVDLAVEATPTEGKLDTTLDLRLQDPKVLLAEVPPLPFGSLQLTAAALVSPDEGSALLRRFTLRGQDLDLEVAGDLVLPDLVGQPEITLSALLPELGGIEPMLAGLPLSITLGSAVDLQGLEAPIAADLDLTLIGTGDLPDGIGPALGEGLTLYGGVTYAPDGAITLKDVTLLGQTLEVVLDGAVGSEQLALDYQVILADLGVAEGLTGTPASGALQLSGAFSQNSADGQLSLSTDIEGSDMTFGPDRIGDLQGQISVAGVLPALSGQVAIEAPNSSFGPLSLSADIAPAGEESFKIAPLTVALGREVQINGDLTVPAAGLPISGRVNGTLNGGRLLANLGVPLEGRGSLTVALSGRGEQQDASVNLELASGRLADIPHGGITLQANARDATGALALDGSLTTGALSVDPAELDRVAVTFRGTPADLTFTVETEGDVEGPTQLSIAGQVAQSGAQTAITLSQLSGQVAGFPLAQNEPTRVTLGPGGPEGAELGWTLAGAALTLDAALAGRDKRVDLALQGLNLKQFERFMEGDSAAGQIAARVSLRGNQRAQGDIAITLTGLSVQEEGLPANPPLDVTVNGQLGDSGLAVNGSVAGNFGQPLRLTADIPVRVSLAEPGAETDRSAPVNAAITWQGEMGPLVDLLPVGEQRLTGQGNIDLRVTGTLENPTVNGTVEVTQGRYENLLTATIIEDLTIRLQGNQQSLQVAEFSGNDGQTGRLSVTGGINLAHTPAPSLNFVVDVNDFALARRDDLYARMDIDMTIDGDLSAGLDVKGTITNQEIRANVIPDLPPGVATLDVEIVRDGKIISGGPPPADAEEEPALPITLDITIDLPRRVFLAGAGLDSEWGGTLTVTGDASQPFITGKIEPLRGFIAIFGKQFDLQEGGVDFDGSSDIDPSLDISAVYEADDLDAIISVTGSAQAPVISLSSDPVLPNDEILSQVLFGRGTGQISPIEALQLAEAAAILSGATGSDKTVVDRLRDTVGIDVLRVEAGEDPNEVVAEVGEYISEDIFVGVRQGTSPGSTQATVEVDLLPGVKLEGRAGADSEADSGAMLRWEYNY
ncbi:MAG: translocation/assembly module TamB domain-containing protein [Pseudomonadota bacterium]